MSRLFPKCTRCQTSHFIAFLKHAHYVCSKCGYHLRLDADTRIKKLCDKKSFKPFDQDMKSEDPLSFPGYRDKLQQSMETTKLNEAIVTGTCTIEDYPTTIGVMDSNFIMASMGSVVGEKVTRMLEYSIENHVPAIIIISSGGARMQEGILSLMQMAKTSAAVKRLNDKGLPLFTVLADPTTGGVTASYTMLGNVIIAEPDALIGFAGPRVIEQTIGQKLPGGFQRSEFLLEHGMLDMVVERKQLRSVLGTLLKIHAQRPYAG
ncbi:MAG: acetyl-CoA carboxylase carboxyltransferase subunit beta [Candidatus Aminicenantes bacterium]|nr:MAG: acetyl-CoA carboxylase carboxyltransferase subunit beta [Candidatus Aminicenantes bacterium]